MHEQAKVDREEQTSYGEITGLLREWGQKDPEALDKQEALASMEIACEALVLFALRHAERAEELAKETSEPARRAELEKIAS